MADLSEQENKVWRREEIVQSQSRLVSERHEPFVGVT